MKIRATIGLDTSSQPIASTPEIINHPQLGFSGVVKCGDQYQINSFSFYAGTLQQLVRKSDHKKLATVLISPPVNSGRT